MALDNNSEALTGTSVGSNGLLNNLEKKQVPPIVQLTPDGRPVNPEKNSILSEPLSSLPETPKSET